MFVNDKVVNMITEEKQDAVLCGLYLSPPKQTNDTSFPMRDPRFSRCLSLADHNLLEQMLIQQGTLDNGEAINTLDETSTLEMIPIAEATGTNEKGEDSLLLQQPNTNLEIQGEANLKSLSIDTEEKGGDNDKDDDDDAVESSSGDDLIWLLSEPEEKKTHVHLSRKKRTHYVKTWSKSFPGNDLRDKIIQTVQLANSNGQEVDDRKNQRATKLEARIENLSITDGPAWGSLNMNNLRTFTQLPGDRKFRFHQVKTSPSPVKFISNSDTLSLFFNDTKSMKRFPSSTMCPLLEIRTSTNYRDTAACIPRNRQSTLKDCIKAAKEYDLSSMPLKCSSKPQKPLCFLKKNYRLLNRDRTTLTCDMSQCGKNPVFVLSLSPSYGTLDDRSRWKRFVSSTELEIFLEKFVIKNNANGFNFCFLLCVRKGKEDLVEQIFTFPQILKTSNQPTNNTKNKVGFNLNIVVLDSVSRPHFYRSLPKTVRNLREIVHYKSYNATVLDFELMQSTAAYTFHNIRALMSGKTDFCYDGKHANETYGIDVLFGEFKRLGFYTLLQEDSCWYDSWGSLFTDNKYQGRMPQNTSQFRTRWQVFQEKVKLYSIDDFGLSHTSCEVLRRYNTTNQFNHPRQVCFGGRAFAEYFLDYIEKIYSSSTASRNNTRILSYTHLNTGHEVTGSRIRQIDQRLSQFMKRMSKSHDTLTVILSDHGPKTTKYSFYTMKGREEKYDPFLFVVLPDNVARVLGLERVHSLIENQHRLITTLDLHKGFMSLGEVPGNKGIFGLIPINRTCADLSMKPLAVCKCEGWEKRFQSNDKHLTWVAEFALGHINNQIQDQYLKGNKRKGGYGRCKRLSGVSFSKIRRRSEGESFVVTMDLKVNPGNEIFEVQVRYPKNLKDQNSYAFLILHERITIYRHFRRCVDDTVSLGICVCNYKQLEEPLWKTKNRKWIEIKTKQDVVDIISSSNSFGAKTKVRNIHSGCLLLSYRHHPGRSTSFEISNACGDRTYSVTVAIKNVRKYFVSRKLPFSIFVPQRTIHFVLVIQQYGKEHHDFKLKVKHTVYYLKNEFSRF